MVIPSLRPARESHEAILEASYSLGRPVWEGSGKDLNASRLLGGPISSVGHAPRCLLP